MKSGAANTPIIIGRSLSTQRLRHFIKIAATSDMPALILGETGVGKEVAARMIHYSSDRREKPFIKVNCATLCDTIIESELFGHRKGAFTSAIIDRPGLIEESNGGTFLFDEIADISIYFQAKLLAVIEDKEVRRLGENRARDIDVRFIFATNRNLTKLVNEGKFRIDLYYRINVITFYIAPLRERKEDIPLLIEDFLKNESQNRSNDIKLSQGALDKLYSHSFPGNIRELQNIIQRAIIFSGDLIQENEIYFMEDHSAPLNRASRYSFDKILAALKNNQGNKTLAARELGISRVYLYKILKDSIDRIALKKKQA